MIELCLSNILRGQKESPAEEDLGEDATFGDGVGLMVSLLTGVFCLDADHSGAEQGAHGKEEDGDARGLFWRETVRNRVRSVDF